MKWKEEKEEKGRKSVTGKYKILSNSVLHYFLHSTNTHRAPPMSRHWS